MLYRRYHKQKNVEKPVQREPVSLPKDDFPKHTGGGWYELSNGDKVQGKDEAEKAEKEAGD